MTKKPVDPLFYKTLKSDYKYGFESPIVTEYAPKGLNSHIIRLISQKKNEPKFMLDFRKKAFKKWQKMLKPEWANIHYSPIDFQNFHYYAAPKNTKKKFSSIDPKIKKIFDTLGVPLDERERLSGIAVDAVLDSVSVVTTFQEKLRKIGVIFCSLNEAIHKYPELIQKYMGSVVPFDDNYFAALNSAVFSDGSFCYIPKNVQCPMELSTYFRINAFQTGQFERTLIIADEGSSVSYLEGCTAPMRDEHQLHAAVVEIFAHKNAEVRYSTVQNWYPGDRKGKGGIYNFVTKRGLCEGENSKISWTQIETGSAITWKYPSVILRGDNSTGEFYSVALTNNYQQADTGTKMIHIGKNTKSKIISKTLSAGRSSNSYRGLIKILNTAENARNYSQCDSLLMGSFCSAHTFPYISATHPSAIIEHEATTSKIGEDQLFYCHQRGIKKEEAVSLIVNGYCEEVMKKLPMEFAIEASRLLALNLGEA